MDYVAVRPLDLLGQNNLHEVLLELVGQTLMSPIITKYIVIKFSLA